MTKSIPRWLVIGGLTFVPAVAFAAAAAQSGAWCPLSGVCGMLFGCGG